MYYFFKAIQRRLKRTKLHISRKQENIKGKMMQFRYTPLSLQYSQNYVFASYTFTVGTISAILHRSR